MIAINGEEFSNTAPLWKYLIISASNVAASMCQYSALEYVSFPVQMLGKSFKNDAGYDLGSHHIWKKLYLAGLASCCSSHRRSHGVFADGPHFFKDFARHHLGRIGVAPMFPCLRWSDIHHAREAL
jgi:hypothetical protein